MIDCPAFVLGNSPRLPDDLSGLRNRFTIGVNRILQRFEPTVLVWVDGTIWQDESEAILACDSLKVCDKSVLQCPDHIGLRMHPGGARELSTPHSLICNGNTGTCAARWAIALGCRPVYLVGMDCEYTDKTDFWGDNRHHGPKTLGRMQDELAKLKAEFPVRELRTQEALDEAVKLTGDVDEDEIKETLRDALWEV